MRVSLEVVAAHDVCTAGVDPVGETVRLRRRAVGPQCVRHAERSHLGLTWKQPASNLLARGCALSTALCVFLHFLLEPTVIPGLGALAATVVAGMIPLALGNFVWDEGFRRGDGQLLAVMAYGTPLCSALLLAALGAALLTWNLLTGAAVIVLAGLLSRADPVLE